MPFADTSRPALGVSLLKAAAARAGFSAHIEYLNVPYAGQIGDDLYSSVADAFPAELLVGEWLFAADVFGDQLPPAADYVGQLLARYTSDVQRTALVTARAGVGGYLDAAAETIAAHRPRVVGFTSTFHQTCSSLAVTRRLKARPDPPVIVFGGANCEGEMGAELLRAFPWIDYVCSGEADESFVPLLRRILDGAAPVRQVIEGAPVEDLDNLPYPDFDDYFAQPAAVGDSPRQLAVETARGCWWGAKRHCTFCGLNGATMAYRSKSPDRAYEEITGLCRTYGATTVSCVDNILDPAYIDTLFPRLEADPTDFNLFYEVKSNLHYDQLVRLRAAGVRHVQPGIESFSDDALRRMRKGVTGFQNLQFLRWCDELGVDCSWNILAGFPGEDPAEYEWISGMAPYVAHLKPPLSCSPIRLDRFSPLFVNAAESGLCRVRPARAYYYVYPLNRRQLSELAYFFDFDYADGRKVGEYVQPAVGAVRAWWDAWSCDPRPRLDAHIDGDAVVVTDTRDVARAAEHVLEGLPARILLHCDQRASWSTLCRDHGVVDGASPDALREALDSLVGDGLVAQRGNRFVTLAVFRDRPADHPSTRPRYEIPIAQSSLAQAPPAEPLLRLGRPA